MWSIESVYGDQMKYVCPPLEVVFQYACHSITWLY